MSNIRRFPPIAVSNARGPGRANQPMSRTDAARLPRGATVNFSGKGIKTQHLIGVDSRARDLNKFPDPNAYRFTLKRPFKNIVKIELVTAEIPHSDFVINENNQKLDVIDDGNTEVVTIPIGDYDCNELANELKIQLDALGYSTWTVVFDNGKYTFTSTNSFSFLFSSGANADSIKTSTDGYNVGYLDQRGSIRQVLGFGITDTASSTTTTSTGKINLSGENYLIMELGHEIRENLDWFDDSGHSAFGKIVFGGDLNVMQCYQESMYDVSRSYDPPLPKLEFLNVKFRTYGGNLYNFRGHEHSFLLRVTTRE